MNDRHYESVAELMAVKPSATNARTERNESFIQLRSVGHYAHKGQSWWGVRNVEEVVRISKDGWPAGLEKVWSSLQVLEMPEMISVRRKKVRKSFGDHLDIQRVYQGDLERAWESTERHPSRGVGHTTTTIFVDINASYSTTADSCFWRGACAIVLADALERAGRSARIIGFTHLDSQYIGHGGQHTTTSILLKDYSDRLDLNYLALTTALAGFYRTWIWRSWASAEQQLASGYGHCRHFSNGLVDKETLPRPLQDQAGEAANVMISSVWSQSQAEKFLREMGGSFGEEQEDTSVRY